MSLFIDMHCHPALKHYLFGHSVYSTGKSSRDNNYADIQVTVPAMQAGNVSAVLSAHYLPEKQMTDDWQLVHVIKPLLKKFFKRYFDKAEGPDAFAQTLNMIEHFEANVSERRDAAIAHNFNEFQQQLQAGKKVFVHALEGAHHLGRGLTAEQYGHNIEQLKAKGVALITLSHFYPNDIAYPVEGIPPRIKHLLRMRFQPLPEVPLTSTGKAVVSMLLDNGILVDLTHTNPGARKEIFAINRWRGAGMRPLVFSHVGVRALFSDKKNPDFGLMSPDDEEILAIKECNGVIGVIFMNYWLGGVEEPFLSNDDTGFNYIINTIQHIAKVTGSFDHIAIGSDFDGMSDPPDDFYNPILFPQFIRRLGLEKDNIGATDDDIEKIAGKNVLRVLRDGWK